MAKIMTTDEIAKELAKLKARELELKEAGKLAEQRLTGDLGKLILAHPEYLTTAGLLEVVKVCPAIKNVKPKATSQSDIASEKGGTE